MRHLIPLVLALGLTSLVDIASNPAAAAPASTAVRVATVPYTGDILIKLKDDSSAESWQRRTRQAATVSALATEHRLPLKLRDAVGARWLRLQPTSNLTTAQQEALLARLRADPRVVDVVPERREQPLAVVPSDTRFTEQWWLQARGAANTGAADFSNAWQRRPAGTGGPVAVLDSGITYHPDLAANVLPGYDFVSDADYAADGDGRDADPSDEGDAISAADVQALPAKFGGCPPQAVSGWHGTVIAGQIGAVSNNANGIAGAGLGTYVLPVRVAAKCGAAQGDIVAGMRWAAGLAVDGVPANPTPARVIVISYGSEAACDAVYADAIADVRAAGAMVIAAAGNQRTSVFRPASCAGTFAVTALNREGYKATYANYGPQVQLATPGGDDANGNTCDDQLADGGLVSTGNLGDSTPGLAGYVAASGTSFAAPSVAATAAMMLMVNPALTIDQVAEGLRSTAAPFVQVPLLGTCAASDNPGRCTCTSTSCGAGQLDANQALAWAASPATWTAPTAQTVTLRDTRIETCARILGREVPPVTPPEPPAPEPPASTGGGAMSPLWLIGLLIAAAALRRRRD